MKEQKGLIRWIKKHKNELAIVGISITTLITLVLGIKNKEMIRSLWNSLQVNINQPSVIVPKKMPDAAMQIKSESIQIDVPAVAKANSLPYEVSQHIRNLHAGQHASPGKIASAMEKDIILMDGQTWVKSYMKGGVAA